ncbi:MAG: DUF4129 domain-containing protein [Candidatus Nanopelagicales bacterium]
MHLPPFDVPIDLPRDPARRLAELELADPAYGSARPGLIQRAIDWLVDWVQRAAAQAGAAAPGGWLGILGLVLLVIVVVLFVRWRVGPMSRASGLTFSVDPGTTAAQYRARAEQLAAAGQWDEAISARMRALVRASQERGLIDAQPGWTADEVAAEVARKVPDARAALVRAARRFDDVRYGGRPGSAEGYRELLLADTKAAEARVAVGAASPGPGAP